MSPIQNNAVFQRRQRLQRKKLRGAFLLVMAMLTIPALLGACGKSEWREVKAPNTGDVTAEVQTGNITPGAAQAGQTAYVAPDRLRARTTPEQNPENSSTVLEHGDPVQIVDPTPIGEDQVVSVRYGDDIQNEEIIEEDERVSTAPVVKTPIAAPRVLETPKKAAKKIVAKKPVYVPIKYLNKTPPQAPASRNEANRYIMIQNIATEKVRVYERSTVAGGPNLLVFESDMIAGENDPKKTRRTALGSYKIEKWIKFYQDNEGLFPSWLNPNHTERPAADLPLPGASLEDWTQSYLMPQVNGRPRGLVRGAFGWYTAKIGPNTYAQWTHGTIGWGADRDRFIKLPKSQLARYYSDSRSFGCTRLENQAIAYLQDLLPVGTKVVKIYAREALADKGLERYIDPRDGIAYQSKIFEWLLTSDGIRKENANSINRPAQLLQDVKEDSILEAGSYKVDSLPTIVEFKKTVKADKLSATVVRAEANLYEIPESSFQGTFLIDEGRVVGYKHPRELRVGGYTDQVLPSVVVKK